MTLGLKQLLQLFVPAQGAIVPVTLIFLATWEVSKVIADRIIARNRERIRQEAREEGRKLRTCHGKVRKEILQQIEGLPEDVLGVEYPSCPIGPKATRRKIEAAQIVIPW